MTTTPSRPVTSVARPRPGPHRPQGRRVGPDRQAAVPGRRTPPAGLGQRRQAPSTASAARAWCSTGPTEFYARIGRDGLIGFGESYMTGAWEAEDLGGFLTVLAAELPNLVPAPLQKLRAAYVRRPPKAQRNTRGQRARQHRPPLRPVQRHVPAVPRRDDELLLGALRHLLRAAGRPPRRGAAGGSRHRVAGRGPGPQDRAAARPDGCRRRHPRARDRHRLGRARDPRRASWRHRALGDAVERAARSSPSSASPRPGTPTR